MKDRHPERKFWLLLALVALVTLVLLSERGLGAPEASATAPPKTIDICKVTVPPGGSGFPFTWANGSSGPLLPFTLNDGQCQPFNVTNQDKYNVFTEIVPAGWTLKNIACTFTTSVVNIIGANPAPGFQPGDNAVTIDLNEQHVTCTFTNSQPGPPPNPPCTGAAGAAFLDISTGKGGIGIADPIWDLISAPTGVPLTAFGVNGPGAWAVAPTGTAWINPSSTGSASTHAAGDYTYQTQFNVPANIATLTLTSTFAADNTIIYSLIDPNGSPTYTQAPSTDVFGSLYPTSPATITVGPPNPKPGKWTLRAVVHNRNASNGSPTATGLLVVGNVRCVAKPSTPTATATPTRTATATATRTATPTRPNPSCLVDVGLNISTGTGGIGIPDPIWTVNAVPAMGIQYVQISWAVPPVAKNPHWINAGTTLASKVYETRFDVPAGIASLTLAFQFAADNNVSFVLLDPQAVTTQINPVLTGVVNVNNFNKLHSTNPPTIIVVPLLGMTNLKPGKYTLRATVGNDPGTPTGLLVVGNVTCAPKTIPTPTRTATPTRTPTPTPRKACGDVNDDGTVNALDALAILQYVAGLTHDLRNLPSANVNGDGTVNALDVLAILQYIAGYDVRLRC